MVALYRTRQPGGGARAVPGHPPGARGGAGPRPVTQPAGARGRDPAPGSIAGPAGPGCRRPPGRRRPADGHAGPPPRRVGETPARSSASRRSASTMRTSSSGASASWPRWSRASPSTAFLGVVGPSGSGKSSAVRAGPRPGDRGRRPRRHELGARDPPAGLPSPCASSIASCSRPSTSRSGRGCPPGRTRSLAAASVLPEGTRLLVIVDQFEEVFTSVDDAAARSAFLESLVGAAGRGRPRSCVALRADFYGRCAEEPAPRGAAGGEPGARRADGPRRVPLGDRGTCGAAPGWRSSPRWSSG